ncbi:MAG: type III-A CRISPR-associated RAMP protein Csm3 [Cytophagales bacterium]|nr:type III-A CRISPR-associated RAMP protein Csm3 [Bernardetiaceae bacterium]MDW8211055.1 type III-A CRISPR-associated RAMP protein Csm3 [Cytophagales bacterium]
MEGRVLLKKIKYTGNLKAITGIRIGDSKESTEIGGVDGPVIRRRYDGQPYLPGSSIKGKMRCLLELVYGENAESNASKCVYSGGEESLICLLFGSSDNKEKINELDKKLEKATSSDSSKEKSKIEAEKRKFEGNQSRLIVRDAYLTEDSVKKLESSPFTDMPYTEVKVENCINRITGKAENPRSFERVPAGAEFKVEFIINIFKGDNEEALIQMFKNGIELLENDYLGGCGSRGYGQVKIHLNQPEEICASKYIVTSNGEAGKS